ncbi:protein FAM189B-like, partial [Notechis scutatus]|uniref:Protein FAM189B-like n=1 Tax=Notechis scutatus TaxID=8663 RepID=A0A6J1W0U8_9SAUR
ISMDSNSLVMSEIVDIPGDSSPSEDSCLLEGSGSACSVDYVLFRSIQRSRADYCLSVDCGQCGIHPQGPFEDIPQARLRGERSFSCSTPGTVYDGLLEAGSVQTHSCHRLEGLGHGAGPCFPEVRVKAKSAVTARKGPRRQRRSSETSCQSPVIRCPLLRSHSDPGMAASREAETNDHEVFCTKESGDDASNGSAETGPCLHTCLGDPFLLAPVPGKSKLELPPKVPDHLSKTITRSLGDLKVCRGSRSLMARFLHRSKRNLTLPGAEMSSCGNKQVTLFDSQFTETSHGPCSCNQVPSVVLSGE